MAGVIEAHNSVPHPSRLQQLPFGIGNAQVSQLDYVYNDQNNSEQILAGGLANFTLKLNENNNLSFKNIYSINSDDKLITRTGEISPLESNPTLLRSNARWFTSNQVYSGQLSGEHLIKKLQAHLLLRPGRLNLLSNLIHI